MRKQFVYSSIFVTLGILGLGYWFHYVYWAFLLVGPLLILGYIDFYQKRQAVRRNFPLLGRFRYIFEAIRPEINQYFVESNSDGKPFSREQRSLVYQRAKGELDTLPFGTQKEVYDVGYEWVNHSALAGYLDPLKLRVNVGGSQCRQPYSASIFNISAMSYGALSSNAIMALNGGAKDGNFAHNTGEGGVSPYHLEPGGDLIWQIGTGYFSARSPDGKFSESHYQAKATLPNIKMIELKMSQGAKPGHGGILPGKKITPEIAAIRGVPMGKDVLSPPSHSAFKTPVEMMQFLKILRDGSGGKPIGFKLCLGKRREFISMIKAMIKTGIVPDFITVDGGEGGTGAAPLEFSNHVGTPGMEGLIFVHNALLGFGLRDQVKVFATGKVTTGFGLIKRLAVGADVVYAARSFMLALGCIQALRCNSNHCPTGVATNDPNLVAGLHISHKRGRVMKYHQGTIHSLAELLGAMGLDSVQDLRPWHIMKRVGPHDIRHYGEIYEFLNSGDLLKSELPKGYARAVQIASPDSFRAISH